MIIDDINESSNKRLKRKVRILLILFVIGLVVSGLTAFPLVWEVKILNQTIGSGTFIEKIFPPMASWITRVHDSLLDVSAHHPFIMYGTDWLAFGHIVIAIVFLGAIRDPVKNIWVIEFGMIACVLVVPTAIICGQIRGIPFFWRLIDCSFGVIGILPLWLAHRYIKKMGDT